MDKEKRYELSNVRVKIVKEAPLYSSEPVDNTHKAKEVIKSYLTEFDREVTGMLCLNSKGLPICFHIVSTGGMTSAIVDPKNVFKVALLTNCASIIFFHCHPSGNVSPSEEDNNMTERLYKAGKLLDLMLLDHLIVGCGTEEMYSYRSNGFFNNLD